jgi:hypothetical protein
MKPGKKAQAVLAGLFVSLRGRPPQDGAVEQGNMWSKRIMTAS